MRKALTLQELNTGHIINRLKTSPVEIIAATVYGSWARGAMTVDSDVDLLLISDAINIKRHKRGKDIAAVKAWLGLDFPMDLLLLTREECISNFRNHNPLFLDIAVEGLILIDSEDFLKNLFEETRAYISLKKLQKLDDGWLFPVLYREPSFLSKISNKDFSIAMLTDGERDLNIGVSIMKEGYFDKAIYHFQQAVEKAVKSILICMGIFKKTHFVGEILIAELNRIELDDGWKDKLMTLAMISLGIEPEVTWSRYPGINNDTLWIPYEEYTAEDAADIREKSEKIIKTAKDFVTWWFKL